MNESNSSSAQGAPRWLVFIPQLPTKPDYLRVKLRRRIQRIGAIALKNSFYILPNRADTAEDFEWLRGELVAEGGDAMLWEASAASGVSDAELEAMFREARDGDYRELIEAIRSMSSAPAELQAGEIARVRRRLDEVNRIDFFGAPGWQLAEDALHQLTDPKSRLSGQFASIRDSLGAHATAGRTWVTREGVFVDRIASAWLIRRFIDPQATFKFVSPRNYTPAAGELRFDMVGGEFTHDGDRCTFETLLERFNLGSLALQALAEIVHDVDCKDGKFGRDESAGVESILSGIVRANSDDQRRLEIGASVFDGLFASASPAR